MVVALVLALILRACSLPVVDRSMSELMNLTSLSPGSRIVVLYPGEPEPFFERILVWPVGHGPCWVSIGGDSRIMLEGSVQCHGTA